MIVYIDIFLLENFIVNLFLLLCTFKVLKLEINKTIYVSAILGTIYSLTLFMNNKIVVSIPIKMIIVILMIMIAIKRFNILKTLKISITFVIISFTLCGITFTLSMLQNNYSIFNNYSIDNYSIKSLLISLMILYIVIVRVIDYFKERAVIDNFIYDIEISVNEKKIFLKGLLDTGNALREPITNLPCIIIESDFLRDINISRYDEFLVPYNTICENGNLIGFKSKEVRIRSDGEKWKRVEVIICSSKNKLSSENEFNALLSRGVV